MAKRKISVAVISDVHLGTYGCHATELSEYLKSIDPEVLILNGDIIDIWNFSKSYFPPSHIKVIRQILKIAARGTKVHYIVGNHDEALRKYIPFQLGNVELSNQVEINLDGKQHWFLHGDIYDLTMKNSKWLAKIGGWAYDYIVLINRAVNIFNKRFGFEPVSLSKKIKDSVKLAVKHISDFENTLAAMAKFKGVDAIVCGHIHEPAINEIMFETTEISYLNSGDWIENLSALEYNNGFWNLYFHPKQESETKEEEEEDMDETENGKIIQLINTAHLFTKTN